LGTDPTTIKVTTRRGSYRWYTEDQVEKLYDLVIEEGKAAKETDLITGINIRTAQHYINRYNDYEERRLPKSILEDMRQKLCETFEGMSISISALHRRLVKNARQL
jgi:hypothetical protein